MNYNTMTVNETRNEQSIDKYIEEPWTLIESYFKNEHLEKISPPST